MWCSWVIVVLAVEVTGDYGFVSYNYEYVDADGIPPTIVSTSPANTSEGAHVTTTIEITFHERYLFGDGHVLVSAPGDVRRISALDVQISRSDVSHETLVITLDNPLKADVEYRVEVSVAFVTDLVGHKYQGGVFFFRTVNVPTSFAVFAPYVQAPDSPVIFAFQTGWNCLYDSAAAQYIIHIQPSHGLVFFQPPAEDDIGANPMHQRCSIVTEVSVNFPPISECRTLGGYFEVELRGALRSETEYHLVIYWPVLPAPISASPVPDEVHWRMKASRSYEGGFVDIEDFAPWRHRFHNYLFNTFASDGGDALSGFTIVPTALADAAVDEWIGPGSVREFDVVLRTGAPGLVPGSRVLFVASPLTLWSTNPARPANLSILRAVDYADQLHLSDSGRRAPPCPNFFPNQLPYTVQCRLLGLGLDTYTYGLELRIPARGIGAGATALDSVTKSFRLSLPGVPQPLAVASRWEAIATRPVGSTRSETHGPRRLSTAAVVVNTTAGLSVRVVSSEHPYPEPVGTRSNRVELEIVTGLFTLDPLEVSLELLEPSSARVERCEASEGTPRLSALPPVVTSMPWSIVRWRLSPRAAGPGPASFVVYPHMRYRTTCLIYNGMRAAPTSIWRLTMTTEPATFADSPLVLTRTFTLSDYVVVARMSGAQILPTLPLLGRMQAVFIRFTLPEDDGITLSHWVDAARHVRVQAPAGFEAYRGPCIGYRPFTSSAMPPLPLSRCAMEPTADGGLALDVTISLLESGFLPGHTYAFRAIVGNPSRWEAVESRVVGREEFSSGNRWSVVLLQDGLPLVALDDVAQFFSADTAALQPELTPESHNTCFRIFRRSLAILDIAAVDPYLGRTTRVLIKFELATPLTGADIVRITAPSAFVFQRFPSGGQVSEFLSNSTPFPTREPEVFQRTPWIIQMIVIPSAEAFVSYGVVLDVTNPSASAWSPLEEEFNMWSIETYYGSSGLLDKRSRRDVGVRKGYTLKGALQSCAVERARRALDAITWVSVAFRLREPIFSRSWMQPRSPRALRVRIPNGYRFAVLPANGTGCTGLVHSEAFPDSPALPLAQFPHGYSPLESLAGFNCLLDSENILEARVLTLQAEESQEFGLLPSLLYAFRVRVRNPVFDQIQDIKWSLETVDAYGTSYEACEVLSVPSLDVVDGDIYGSVGASFLPTQKTTPTLIQYYESMQADVDGNFTVEVSASPGFVFPRHCIGSVSEMGKELVGGWQLLSCVGSRASATLKYSLDPSQGVPQLRIPLQARAPSFLDKTRPIDWSVGSIYGHGGSQAIGINGSRLREMGTVALQPLGKPVFTSSPDAQGALLTLTPSTSVPSGGFILLRAPRHASYTFDTEIPCAQLGEDPETLVSSTHTADVQACNPSCTWPEVSSCDVMAAGTKLLVRLRHQLEAGTEYCFSVQTRSPATRAPELLLPMSVVALGGARSEVMDLAPLVLDDRGQGWGVAPYVREAAHTSLCYSSRVPTDEPIEVVVHLVPSSLGVSGALMSLTARICLKEAAIAEGVQPCRVLTPSGVDASCIAATDGGCDGACLLLSGSLWSSFGVVAVAVMAVLLPGRSPWVDIQIFDGGGALIQGGTSPLNPPILSRLSGIALTAPPSAAVNVAFAVTLQVDWPAMLATFLEELLSDTAELPAFLDIQIPPGLHISLLCHPIACAAIIPDEATPKPGLRLFLQQPRLQGRRLQRSGFTPAAAPPVARELSEVVATTVAELLDAPLQEHFLVTAAYPQGLEAAKAWTFTLRSASLRALGAAVLPGFGVARRLSLRVAASSQRAGDVFSLCVVEFEVPAPLAAGAVVVLEPPVTAEGTSAVTCRTAEAEPTTLIGPLSASVEALLGALAGACALELRQPLQAGVRYSFSLPLTNPILTPEPNMWTVKTFAAGPRGFSPHAVAHADGFEVSGEFDLLAVRSKSAYPDIVAPTALSFKLRTPLPLAPAAVAGPGAAEPAVRLRLEVFGVAGARALGTFDPGACALDVLTTSVLVHQDSSAVYELLMPSDCIVTNGGASVEFLFERNFDSRVSYVIWTWMKNPTLEAAQDPGAALSASTVTPGGSVVHRISMRPAPLLGLLASALPGAYVAGLAMRAVLQVRRGQSVIGPRGAVEVTLPQGFHGSCSEKHFRPRPNLPSTARCRGHVATGEQRSRIVVYWRTLLGSESLITPYEFAFQLTVDLGVTYLPSGPEGAWHVRAYEGDNQEFLVDGTPLEGFRPFNVCPSLTALSVKREDARIVSVVFKPIEDLPRSFDNLLRVELVTSARAPATARCPETSVWQLRYGLEGHVASEVQGMPPYTVCVEESPTEPLQYLQSALQHRSSVLFLLPFASFGAAEHYGFEVVLDRSELALALARDSPSELSAELINIALETGGARLQCGSMPLGPVPGLRTADDAAAAEADDAAGNASAAARGSETVTG